MTPTTKSQVFDPPVEVTTKDAERLAPFLSGSNRLAKALMRGLNEPDLKRLILLELAGKRRRVLLGRLVGRLTSLARRRVEERIARVTGKPQTGWHKLGKN